MNSAKLFGLGYYLNMETNNEIKVYFAKYNSNDFTVYSLDQNVSKYTFDTKEYSNYVWNSLPKNIQTFISKQCTTLNVELNVRTQLMLIVDQFETCEEELGFWLFVGNQQEFEDFKEDVYTA